MLAEGDPVRLVRAALQGAAWPHPLARIAPPGVLDRAAADAALTALAESGEVVPLAGAEPTWLAQARYAELLETVREQLERRAAEHPLEPVLPAGAVVPAGPGADALLRASPPTASSSATGRTSCSPARAPMPREGTPPRPMRCWRRSRPAASPPDLVALQLDSGLAEREFAALAVALERAGRLVRFGGDLAYSSEHFERAREIVVARCEANGSVPLAELRDELGASRRIAQALLERLDADGVTRRVEDRRVLRRRASA